MDEGADTDSADRPKRRTRLRRVLIGLVVVTVVFGGVITWLFLFPARPPLTVGTSVNCQELAMCSRRCAADCPSGVRKLPCMSNCTKRCTERGCASARPLYREMVSCVRTNCLMKCIAGPGPACDECSERECADTRAACFAQVCPAE